MAKEIVGDPLLPGQRLAICKIGLYERSALLFDRIITPKFGSAPIEPPIPPSIGFYVPELEQEIGGEYILDTLPHGEEAVLNLWVSVYNRENIEVIPVYTSEVALSKHFPEGPELAFQAALQHIPVVAEASITWDRVIDFRKDSEAIRKYRDLRLWLEMGLQAKSLPQALDIISQKIDDYTWAIKKHGLETKIGYIRQLLGWKQTTILTAGTAISTLLGGPVWGAIAAGTIISSEITASVAESKIKLEDTKRGKNREIAYLLELREKLGK